MYTHCISGRSGSYVDTLHLRLVGEFDTQDLK
jgi:hypothetical protein